MRVALKNINYFYLAFTILWPPLRLAFLDIDGMGRVVFFITIIVFFLNFVNNEIFRKILTSKPVIFWGIWILYSIINLLFKGYYEEQSFMFFIVLRLLQPFLVMCLVVNAILFNPPKTITLLSIIYFIYGFLSVTVLGGKGSIEETRVIGQLGNMGPLTTIFLIFFTSLLHSYSWINLKLFIPAILFSLFVPTIAATRKAVSAAIIMLIFWGLGNFKFNFRNIFLILLFTITLKIGYDYTMDMLPIGQRFVEGVEEGENYNTTNIKALNFLGDRVVQYINAWEIFVRNPLTGIGLRNFLHKTSSIYVLHSEYMVQLSESGLIGTFFYLGFNLWIIFSLINLFRVFKSRRKEIFILCGGFLAILFINITAWTYDFPGIFIVYGVIIGSINKIRIEATKKKYASKKNYYLDKKY